MTRLSPFFLLLFWSCAGNDVPKGVLPPDKMEAVLYDVIRADEWVDFAVLQDSTFRNFSRRTALYDSVFRLHAINKEDYRNSVRFYQSRPDLLKGVLESLRTKSDTAMKRAQDRVAEKAKADTLPTIPVDTVKKIDTPRRLSLRNLKHVR